jgi:hypothetical protein
LRLLQLLLLLCLRRLLPMVHRTSMQLWPWLRPLR